MRARSTQLAGAVSDRAIASSCAKSCSPIEISITRRVAAIVTRHQVQFPARLQHVGQPGESPTTGWFYGIDVLGGDGRRCKLPRIQPAKPIQSAYRTDWMAS